MRPTLVAVIKLLFTTTRSTLDLVSFAARSCTFPEQLYLAGKDVIIATVSVRSDTNAIRQDGYRTEAEQSSFYDGALVPPLCYCEWTISLSSHT